MEDSVELTITLSKQDAEKLRKLAGSDAEIAAYLARTIQRLYNEYRIFGDKLNLEQLVSAAEAMADRNRDYEESVRLLHERLKRMTMSHEALMATVDHLRGVTTTLRNTIKDRTID